MIYFFGQDEPIDNLKYPLMVAGVILFLLDALMIQVFCAITFTFLNMLSPGGCNRKTNKILTKLIYLCFVLRAFSANLMSLGPSVLDLIIYDRSDCPHYHVYCYIDTYNGLKESPINKVNNIFFINQNIITTIIGLWVLKIYYNFGNS